MKFHKDAASKHQSHEILCLDSNLTDHCSAKAETIKFYNKVSVDHDQGHYQPEEVVVQHFALSHFPTLDGWR
jgi:hypothetical protein